MQANTARDGCSWRLSPSPSTEGPTLLHLPQPLPVSRLPHPAHHPERWCPKYAISPNPLQPSAGLGGELPRFPLIPGPSTTSHRSAWLLVVLGLFISEGKGSSLPFVYLKCPVNVLPLNQGTVSPHRGI